MNGRQLGCSMGQEVFMILLDLLLMFLEQPRVYQMLPMYVKYC